MGNATFFVLNDKFTIGAPYINSESSALLTTKKTGRCNRVLFGQYQYFCNLIFPSIV